MFFQEFWGKTLNMDLYFKDTINRLRIKKFDMEETEDGILLKETPEWKEYKRQQSSLISLNKSNLPPHTLNLTLEDYVGGDRDKIDKLSLYVDKFEEKFNQIHLYFWSTENGTQKTTTACTVGKLLLEKGFTVQFALMGNLLRLLSEVQFKPELLEELNKYRNCDYLIIDDSFDRRKATIYKSGFQIPFLDEFLRTRLEVHRKATCFTSNFSIDEIDEEVFGRSLKHLIKRNILDPFHFASSYELRNDFDIDTLWS